MPHICVSQSDQHWFRKWLVAYSTPSHYLIQCCVIVNWTLRDKLKWDFDQNTKIFIHENAYENIVCEITAILSGEDGLSNAFEYYILKNYHTLKITATSSRDQYLFLWISLWRHQMKTFSALLSLCAGKPPVTVGFPSRKHGNTDLWCFSVVSLTKLLNKHSIDR